MSERSGRRRGSGAVLALNLLVMLFPPVHLGLAGGDITLAIAYFMGGSLLLVLSMLWLSAEDDRREPA